MDARSTREVFEDHLELADRGEVEADIARNFAPDCVLLTGYGVFRGHAGVRDAAALLARQLPEGRFVYRTRLCEDDVAFLEWTGDSAPSRIPDGADSFVIRDGRIQTMTIHYTVESKTA